MKIKNFFKNTKKTLGINASKDEEISKKKRLEELLEKLKSSKSAIKEKLKTEDLTEEQKIELKEEINVYCLQIKKGEEILEKKNNK